MTQSIIVYRNPLEEVFWRFAMSAEGLIFAVGVLVFLISVACVDKVLRKILPARGCRSNLIANLDLGISAVISILVMGVMFSRIS